MALRRAVSMTVQSAYPYSIDFSRYVPPTLTDPVLVWLPLRPYDSEELTSVRSVEQGAPLRVCGSGSLSWDGSPEAGWSGGAHAKYATWTDQALDAPNYLLPDDSETLAPTALLPNVVYDLSIRDLDALNQLIPATTLLYDYLSAPERRITLKRDKSYSVDTWAGLVWGGTVSGTYPGSLPILSAYVFPDHAGYVIALTSDGLQMWQIPLGTTSAVIPIPPEASDGILKTTPWGAYLVGSKGYGLITAAVGDLTLDWRTLSDGNMSLLPGTFAGLDSGNVMAFSRFDGQASGSTDTVTETHLMRLSAVPVEDAKACILDSEKILDGVPVLAGAMRDPSLPGRIIGHCGGRLFVYGRTLPKAYAIERYTPSSISALELIELVCQVLDCMAVPDSLGTMHVISRGLIETPIPLVVDRVEVVDTRAWENHYSLIRVSSAKDTSLLSDARGIPGGDVLEYSQHPFLWTKSGCTALSESLIKWFGVPRRYREESWFHTDPNSAPPWEKLPPVSTITVNDDPTKWIVIGIDDDKTHGEATVKLVEVF